MTDPGQNGHNVIQMSEHNLFIETDRLILRPFTEADIAGAYEMNLDVEVSKYTGDGGVVSYDEIARRIKEHVLADYQKYGYGRLAVEVKGGDKFIGFAGLKYLEDLKAVDLGYRFMSNYWGKGYATEAARALVDFGFKTLGLKELIAMTLPENQGSIRVLEKLHFNYDKQMMDEGDLVNLYRLKSTING